MTNKYRIEGYLVLGTNGSGQRVRLDRDLMVNQDRGYMISSYDESFEVHNKVYLPPGFRFRIEKVITTLHNDSIFCVVMGEKSLFMMDANDLFDCLDPTCVENE